MHEEGLPMTGRLFALSAFFVALVGSPAIATATDYHHVHLVAPSRAEAKEWYMTHMGCTDYGRPDACQIGNTYIIFLSANRPVPVSEAVSTILDFPLRTSMPR